MARQTMRSLSLGWRRLAGVALTALVAPPAPAVPPPPPSAPSTSTAAASAEPERRNPSVRIRRAKRAIRRIGTFTDTGADDCFDTTAVPLPVGPPGSPASVTVSGNTGKATGPECSANLLTAWWEAFEIDQCATVTLDFCGTDPAQQRTYLQLAAVCDAEAGSCSTFISANDATRADCGDNNVSMRFDSLAPGKYFYPIIANPAGPYVMHLTAEECVGTCAGCRGACCDSDTFDCTDDVVHADCANADQTFHARQACCEVECRSNGAPGLDVNLLANVPVDQFPGTSSQANDIWGYTSPRGHKYAILGLDAGTGFVRVTDPRNPVVLGEIPDDVSIWGDMKTFAQFAYKVNEAAGGMQVIDLRQIDSGSVSLHGAVTGGLSTAHNVAVNPQSGYAYPVGSNLAGGGLLAFDLAVPGSPVFAGSWNETYIHDAQVVSYDACPAPGHPRNGTPCEIAFAFCGQEGLYIIDVTDKAAMDRISRLNYATVGYCHQGWLSPDRQHLFFNDELDETFGTVENTTTYVVDVSNLTSPQLVTTYAHPGCHIDHNLMTRGDRVYQAHYTAGLRVLDASDPTDAYEVAFYDTRPEDNFQIFEGSWGTFPSPDQRTVLVSDMSRGLFVLCDKPELPIASFVISAVPAPPDEAVTLDATYSTTCDPDRSIAAFEWDLDYDGFTFHVDATGPSVAHTFAAPATAALRVTDDLGAADVATLPVPVVGFTALPLGPAANSAAANRTAAFASPPAAVASGSPPVQTAIRVRLTRMYIDEREDADQGCPERTTQPDLTQFESQTRWAGPPAEFPDEASPAMPNIVAAKLQCCPYFRDWSPLALSAEFGPDADVTAVHLYGKEITPCSIYDLQQIRSDCPDPDNEGCFSPPLVVQTAKWGDAWTPQGGPTQPNVLDVTKLVDKFRGLPYDPGPPEAGAPSKTRAMLRGNSLPLSGPINVTDVTRAIDAFRGLPYPEHGPDPDGCAKACP